MTSIAIILPAFNEETTIAETIKSFSSQIPNAKIFVIDNNSNDKTAEVTKRTFQNLKIRGRGNLLYEGKQGKAAAIRRSFLEIDADIYVISDADMTYPADRIKDLINPIINNEADMVVGDRHSLGNYRKNNKRSFHNFGNFIVNTFVNVFFDAKISDVMSGYRALSREFVENYPILVEGFQIETDLTLFALDKGYRIKEVPISYNERPANSFSKLSTFKDGAKVLFIIFHTLRFYKPLLFFSYISAALFILSMCTSAPVINEFILTSAIRHVPLAILSAAIMILSMIAIAIGLILDSIKHQNKINFELRIIDFWRNKKINGRR